MSDALRPDPGWTCPTDGIGMSDTEIAGTTSTTDDFVGPDVEAAQPWERLAAYLNERGMKFSPDPLPRQFACGFGNLNYLIAVDGRPKVLRRPPEGPLPPGGNDMAREYRVLSRLWRRFPLAPRAEHFCKDETVLGAPFFIMEYRPGVVVRKSVPSSLKGLESDLSAMMVEVLTAFHAVRPEEVELDDLGRPEGFLGRAVEGWIKRAYVASQDIYDDGAPPEAARALEDWLEGRPAPDGDVTLLHNDFKLDNIILDAAAPTRPIAVLDWDMCTRGDPLFDLATLLSYWTEPGDPPAMHDLGQMPTGEPGFLSRQEVVDLYGEMTGRDLSDFLFYRVLTIYKLGAVFLQLYARYRRGTTRDRRYENLGRIGEGVFAFGIEVARGRAF